MRPSSDDETDGTTHVHPATDELPRSKLPHTSFESSIHHPTSLFRRLLTQSSGVRRFADNAVARSSPAPGIACQAPRMSTFLAIACLLGIASGFLELAVLEIQVHALNRVDWGSLLISRHIIWMVPATAPLVMLPLAMILVWPALALLAWRSRRGKPASPLAETWVWGWARGSRVRAFPAGPTICRPRSSSCGAGRPGDRLRLSPLALAGEPGDRMAPPLVPGSRNHRLGATTLAVCSVESGGSGNGTKLVPNSRGSTQLALDCRRHAPGGPHEPLWV